MFWNKQFSLVVCEVSFCNLHDLWAYLLFTHAWLYCRLYCRLHMSLVSFPSSKCSFSEYLHVLTTLHMNRIRATFVMYVLDGVDPQVNSF